MLRLQARFICNKRLEKIIAVFPRTFEILGADQRLILREFVAISRPTKTSTLANATEFHEFLSARWEYEAPNPAHLADVAACELAMIVVRDVIEDRGEPAKKDKNEASKRAIRCRSGVVPLRCAYDVRSVFDAGSGQVVPPKRDTSLVVTLLSGFRDVGIVEVDPVVVAALTLLDNWTDPSMLDDFGDDNLVSHLAVHGLIDVQG